MAKINNTVNIQQNSLSNSVISNNNSGYNSYLTSMLMLGNSSYHHLKEITGYANTSMNAYVAGISEIIRTGDSSKAASKFESLMSLEFDRIRQEALNSPFGSILGPDKDLAEMSNAGAILHSIGLLPEMISQPIAMIINATAIEASRRIFKPEMDFYEYAQLEDTDPRLRSFKSARQAALLFTLALTTGGAGNIALGTTVMISGFGVVGNRLLKVGHDEVSNGQTRTYTLSEALLNTEVFNQVLDASFNSRTMSMVTPILLGAKIVSKLYDNVDTVNDVIVSIASGHKVGYEKLLADPTTILRASGHALVVTAAMMDLFDFSIGGIAKKQNAIESLAKLQEEIAKKLEEKTPKLPQATVTSSNLYMPVIKPNMQVIGLDENSNPIYSSRNNRVFYLSNLTTLINPSQELRDSGFFSPEVDRMVDDYGEAHARKELTALLGLSDLSETSGKISFVVNKLPTLLLNDLEIAVQNHVMQNGLKINDEQYAAILEWNIRRVERSIQIHEVEHLRSGADERNAWQMSNDFLAFDADAVNGLVSVKLGLVKDKNILRIYRPEDIGAKQDSVVSLAEVLAKDPQEFSTLWTGPGYNQWNNKNTTQNNYNLVAFSPNSSLVLNQEIEASLKRALEAVNKEQDTIAVLSKETKYLLAEIKGQIEIDPQGVDFNLVDALFACGAMATETFSSKNNGENPNQTLVKETFNELSAIISRLQNSELRNSLEEVQGLWLAICFDKVNQVEQMLSQGILNNSIIEQYITTKKSYPSIVKEEELGEADKARLLKVSTTQLAVLKNSTSTQQQRISAWLTLASVYYALKFEDKYYEHLKEGLLVFAEADSMSQSEKIAASIFLGHVSWENLKIKDFSKILVSRNSRVGVFSFILSGDDTENDLRNLYQSSKYDLLLSAINPTLKFVASEQLRSTGIIKESPRDSQPKTSRLILPPGFEHAHKQTPVIRELPKKAKVVIVGSGPAGTGAFYELARAGLIRMEDVVMLEALSEFGGRAETIITDGAMVDTAAQYLGDNQSNYRIAKDLGVPVREVEDGPYAVFVKSRIRGQKQGDLLLGKMDSVYDILTTLGGSAADNNQEADVILEQMDSVYGILTSIGARINGVHPWETENIEMPVTVGKRTKTLKLNLKGTPAVELYDQIKRLFPDLEEGVEAVKAFEEGTQGVALDKLNLLMHLVQFQSQNIKNSDPDGHVYVNGANSLIQEMINYSGRDRCFTDCEVTAVDHVNSSCHKVKLADGREIEAEIVIFAVPPNARPRINSKFLQDRQDTTVGKADKLAATTRQAPDRTWTLDLVHPDTKINFANQESWAFKTLEKWSLYLFGSGESLDRWKKLPPRQRMEDAMLRVTQMFYERGKPIPEDLKIVYRDWDQVPSIGGSYTVPVSDATRDDVQRIKKNYYSTDWEKGVFVIGEDTGPGYNGSDFGYVDGAIKSAQITVKKILEMLLRSKKYHRFEAYDQRTGAFEPRFISNIDGTVINPNPLSRFYTSETRTGTVSVV